MGDSPESIPTRLARGEAADVVILDGGAADELASAGLLRADTKVTLGALADRHGGARGRAEARHRQRRGLQATLLAAKSIAYSDSGSGTYLSTQLFAKLGIADQVLPKSRRVRGPPSGEPVAAVVARGEAEIGFQQVSELINVEGTIRRRHSGGAAAGLHLRRGIDAIGRECRRRDRAAAFPQFAGGRRGQGEVGIDAGWALTPSGRDRSLCATVVEQFFKEILYATQERRSACAL